MLKQLISIVPSNNAWLYKIARWYTDLYGSQNNHRIDSNGELRLLNKIIGRCQCVFDVGANDGEWTRLALQINPHLMVHCFEPSLFTFQRLVENNFPDTVTCNNVGLSSAPGEATLHIFSDGAGINTLYPRQGLDHRGLQETKLETVRLIRLDDYCHEHSIRQIDYLKLDVEGHELSVLAGATEMLKEHRIKYIQFEYGGCNIDSGVLLKDIFHFLKKIDYRIFKIYPTEVRRIPDYSQQFENFQYQNWLAIARSTEIDNKPIK